MTDSAGNPQASRTNGPGHDVSLAEPVLESAFPAVSSEDYHADSFHDGPPSLSASIAHLMLTRSPAHAKHAHPRLNPDYVREEDPKFDLGRAVHQVLLEGNKNIVVVPEGSWRTKAAKEAREEAWRVHMTALLEADWERVLAMVDAINEQLAGMGVDPLPFTAGQPEVTLTWSEPNGVRCRCRIDWLHEGATAISDLKTTSRSASGPGWSRGSMFDHGCDLQAAFYLRGVREVYGCDADWRFVVVETQPPFGLRIVRPGKDVLALADAKVSKAIKVWGDCLALGEWPSYPPEPFEAELPPGKEAEWFQYEAEEAA